MGMEPSSSIVPPKTITSAPHCLGCGFTVAKQGDVCDACRDKPQFQGRNVAPKATIEVAPQPEPAYLRRGNFARPIPQDDTLPEES